MITLLVAVALILPPHRPVPILKRGKAAMEQGVLTAKIETNGRWSAIRVEYGRKSLGNGYYLTNPGFMYTHRIGEQLTLYTAGDIGLTECLRVLERENSGRDKP